MNSKQKSVLLRYLRSSVATLAALLAVWVTGPAVLGYVYEPALQSLIVVVVAPALVALDKALRQR